MMNKISNKEYKTNSLEDNMEKFQNIDQVEKIPI